MDDKNIKDDWKEKYAALVAESDGSERERQTTEKLLCRTIIRLTLAANGLDSSLDPYLKKLRTILKGGVDSEKLRKQVDEVSEALLRAEDNSEIADLDTTDGFDAGILFDFLRYCAKGTEVEHTVKKVESDFSSNKFQDSTALFSAIAQALDPASADVEKKTGLLARLFGKQKKPAISNEGIDGSAWRGLLTDLLDSLEMPVTLQHKHETIKRRVADSDELSQFFKTLEEIVQLLLSIKSRAKEEQEEINGFLSGLQEQLEKLDSSTKNVRSIVNEASEAQNRANLGFSDDVDGLMVTTGSATSLEALQQALKSKLDSMSEQIEARLAQDKERDLKVEARFGEMTTHIQLLETEATEMRSALKLKNDQALNDALTGIPNRLAYDERIINEFARWKRFNTSLMLLVWDIDHFKNINDRFGHQAGDIALRKIATVFSSEMRETDFVARYGGEEFAMLLPGASPEEALKKANVIRDKVKNCGFNSKGKPIAITASCGLTGFSGEDTPEKAFARADKALYQAKDNGRDQCVKV